jgi:hypothetical protein
MKKPPQTGAGNPAGRPSDYTAELAAMICERLTDGESQRSICRDEGMPAERTVRRWALENEEFSPQYARAREIGYLCMADEMLEIADTTQEGVKILEKTSGKETVTGDMIEHRRLQVDTRKWMLARMLPKIFGDRQHLEHSGSIGFNEELIAARERARKANAAG